MNFKNIPDVKLGIVAVSRDCFPMELSAGRRQAVVAAYKKLMGKFMNVLQQLKVKFI